MVMSNSITSTSLLNRLRQSPLDQAAWSEFVARYGRRVHHWCRRFGLQVADAEDVTQTVLLKLLLAMQTFRYDPALRFRAWLKTVTHHAWQDLIRSRRVVAVGGQSAAEDPHKTLPARDELAARLEAEYQQELVERALERVRLRVQPQTWDAFHLTTFDGLSGAEVAKRVGMPVTSVYKARSNIQSLLEAEVQYLEGGQS
jgi:RNA polymerase sigma-70 factor (ECF subfamily)